VNTSIKCSNFNYEQQNKPSTLPLLLPRCFNAVDVSIKEDKSLPGAMEQCNNQPQPWEIGDLLRLPQIVRQKSSMVAAQNNLQTFRDRDMVENSSSTLNSKKSFELVSQCIKKS